MSISGSIGDVDEAPQGWRDSKPGSTPFDAGAFIARSAFRLDEDAPTYSDHHIGFRIVAVRK